MNTDTFHILSLIIYHGIIYFIFYLFGCLVAKFWLWLRVLFLFLFLGGVLTASQNITEYNVDYFLNIILPVLCLILPSIQRAFHFSIGFNFDGMRDWIAYQRYKTTRAKAEKRNSTFRPEREENRDSKPQHTFKGKTQENGNSGAKIGQQEEAPSRQAQEDYSTRLLKAYQLLGVTPILPYEEIRKKFLNLRRDYDPMRYEREAEWIKKEAHNKSIELQNAFNLIKEHLGER